MFVISDDLTINITRGDTALFHIKADINGTVYQFKVGDEVRLNVFTKKDCGEVVLSKTVNVNSETESVEIELTSEETKIGEVISRPVDYWYEIELNPDTKPQTIVGYDEDGAKVFRLYPEGGIVNE